MNASAHEHTPAVETRELARSFGHVVALDHVSLSIAPGEFFSLLGPSGCGKTTLLRLIAGLEVPDSGRVLIHGSDATDLPAHRRPVNTVFQSYALFPHLDVWNNVAFGLRMKGVARADIERRVQAVLQLVEIPGLEKRRPSELSGGQKQRVALARAIVNEPQVLLLDEPLAALDLKLRKQLQVELHAVQRRLRTTFIYVTHDQEEALVLSDRIAVMNRGRIEQIGTGRELYETPRTRFVVDFLGSCTLLEATLAGPSPDGFVASTPVGELRVAGTPPAQARFTLAIRPEKIGLEPHSTSPAHHPNAVAAKVERRTYVGAETHFDLRAGNVPLRVECMNAGSANALPNPGQEVRAILPPEALIILED